VSYISVIIYGYIFLAILLVYFLLRDIKIKGLFFNKHKNWAYTAIIILLFGIFCAIYAHLIEPFVLITKKVDFRDNQIKQPIKIIFVSDIQAGNHKKTAWVEKVAQKIMATDPDLVVFGGDLIDNEGNSQDETKYLEPLRKVSEKFPSFFVLGNHEYGLGQADRAKDRFGSGNRSQDLINKMAELNITFLKNTFACPLIKNQTLCLFGIDDIYAGSRNYAELKNIPTNTPFIFITHNPDGIIGYPEIFPAPILALAGHSHGGQVYVPLLGPLGSADIVLPKHYYRGLNYWKNIPIFTSVGAGESGGQVRFLAVPEIVSLTLTP